MRQKTAFPFPIALASGALVSQLTRVAIATLVVATVGCSDTLPSDPSDGVVVPAEAGEPATAAAAAAALTVTTTADTFDGVCNSNCSLKDAIYAANQTPDHDDVVLQAGALYVINTPYSTTPFGFGTALPEVVTPIRIIGAGATIERLSSAPRFWFFTVSGQFGDLVLEQLTLRGGNALNSYGGSAVNCFQASLTVRDSFVENNVGGPAVRGANARIVVERSTFRNNNATGANSTSQGAALLSDGDGDSSNGISPAETAAVTITRSAFINNRADNGGGIFLRGSHEASVTDSTFYGNEATQYGGAIYFHTLAEKDDNGHFFKVRLRNLTITGNRAGVQSGGIEYQICGAVTCPFPTYPTVSNTILANNTVTGTPYRCHNYACNGPSMFISEGNNVVGNGASGFCNDWVLQSSDQTFTGGPTAAYPGLAPIASTSKPGGDFLMPYEYSVAARRGSCSLASSVDQLGKARYGICEVGAVEAPALCVEPPAGLMSWWPFDSTTGLNDIAATPSVSSAANPPAASPGFVAGAVCFDGVNDKVSVPNHADHDIKGDCLKTPEDFTFDTWVRTTRSGVQILADKRLFASNYIQGWEVFLYNGRVGFQMATGVGNSSCGSTGSACTNFISPANARLVNDGNWHFIAITVERCTTNGGTMYVDGQPVYTFTPRNGNLTNTSALTLGDASFQGCLDEVEVFSRALWDYEVLELWNAEASGKCKP